MTDSLDRVKSARMTTAKQQIARMRQELDVLEQLIDDAGEDEGADIDLDAWIERNKDAIDESLEAGDAAMARGDYFQGTVDELREMFLSEAGRFRAAAKSR